jgi:hypothetical protein
MIQSGICFPFDEYLSLARPGFWRKKFEEKWLIPSASVLQVSEHFAQNWSLGFGKNDVPKLAFAFKVVLGAAQTRHVLRQLIGMVKVRQREVTVCRFDRQRDEREPEFREVRAFCSGQRFHNRTLVWANNDRAFFVQGDKPTKSR